MRHALTGLLSFALVFGIAGTADAKANNKRHAHYYYYNPYSPSAIAERQRHASTFDETQYYEHDIRKIPFGTATWWRQREIEGPGRRR